MPVLDRFLQIADDAIRFPHSALRIAELADQADTPNSVLVAQVSEDPAFSARLLRLVNSSAFPGQNSAPIASIDNALVRVGRQKISELAMLQASAAAFGGIQSDLLRATTFWTHSQETAVVARRLAGVVGVAEGSCYVGGLLHDIGLLLMFHSEPEEMGLVLEFSLDESVSLVEAEEELLGISHPQLGGRLAQAWNLPSSLANAIAYHHTPWEQTLDGVEASEQGCVACVALANELAGDTETALAHDNKVLAYARQVLDLEGVDLAELTLAGCDEASALEPVA